MIGRVSTARQVEAGERAAALYRELGKPRRLFSTLIRLSQYQGDVDVGAADASMAEARALLRPDWPVEYQVMRLRRDAGDARRAGRKAEAETLAREAIRQCREAGDWRLEVMHRTVLTDMLWELGPLTDAAQEARALAQDLRERPTAPGDMDVSFTNLLGIESELGNLEAAAAVARETQALLVRTGGRYHEAWVHFFWRSGQHDIAAMLLGECDARGADHSVQVNEVRLREQARAGLAAAMSAEALEARKAAGAALTQSEVVALLAQGLNNLVGRASA
jgi:hypothetical protein